MPAMLSRPNCKANSTITILLHGSNVDRPDTGNMVSLFCSQYNCVKEKVHKLIWWFCGSQG